MIVGVLALDQVMGYELMIPGLVFGMANLAAAELAGSSGNGTAAPAPEYEVRVCAHRPSISTVADWGMVEIRTSHGFDALGDADLAARRGRGARPDRYLARCPLPSLPPVSAASADSPAGWT